jgi:tRNA nucleotidyltransferase (CCA-adding enzyme)
VLSVLFHDIAKPPTTEEKEKRGRMTITSEGHEELGGQMVLDILPQFGFHEELILPISKLVANHLAGVNISMIEKPSSRNRSVKKLSRRLIPATIKQLLYVMEADTNGRGGTEFKEPTGAKEILAIADEINVVEKPYQYILMGRHLLEIGLKPSPDFKKILDKSYEAQENGDFSDVEGAKKWLNENVNEILCNTKWIKRLLIHFHS